MQAWAPPLQEQARRASASRDEAEAALARRRGVGGGEPAPMAGSASEGQLNKASADSLPTSMSSGVGGCGSGTQSALSRPDSAVALGSTGALTLPLGLQG